MATSSTITVELGERRYPITIGNGLLGAGYDLAQFVAGPDCLIVSNQTVAPLYSDDLRENLAGKSIAVLELPDGESHKTVATAQKVLDKLIDLHAGRDATVIALGGGVVGDIAGFAAACYMRGIAFIQVPTTLLAQVDSSVGGKTGVNHPKGKNLIGAFHQPRAVLIDTETLRSLADRELVAGLAEVIKYGAICDLDFFAWLEDNIRELLQKDPQALEFAIRRSCEIKAEIVAADEREAGRRATLNFGHTFGHAIEQNLGYGEWLHGEAVAAGMVMAARLSEIGKDEVERLIALLVAAGLPVEAPKYAEDRWIQTMSMDKKVQQNAIRFVLLHALGDAFVSSDYDAGLLQQIVGATT